MPRTTRERLALLEAKDELQTTVREELRMVLDVLDPDSVTGLAHWDWYDEYLHDLDFVW